MPIISIKSPYLQMFRELYFQKLFALFRKVKHFKNFQKLKESLKCFRNFLYFFQASNTFQRFQKTFKKKSESFIILVNVQQFYETLHTPLIF